MMGDITIDSDSDDELVTPLFLIKPKTTSNEILTPRKGIQPTNDALSPLTPVSEITYRGERSGKAKFSLSSLLNEKAKAEVIQEKEDDIKELKIKFEEGDYMELAEEENGADLECSQLSQSQDYDLSQDTLQESFSQQDIDNKNKENLKQVTDILRNDFPDTFPGVQIFIYPPQNIDLFLTVRTLVDYIMGPEDLITDEEIKQEDLNEFLYDVLQACTPCYKHPDNVCDALWRIVYSCKEYRVSQSALRVLTNLICNQIENDQWLPTVDHFLKSLSVLGADHSALIPENSPESILKLYNATDEEKEQEFIHDTRATRKAFNMRLHNFASIIQLITICIQKHPLKYCIDDLNVFILLAFRLCLEKITQLAVWDIKVLIGAVIDAYSSTQWKDELQNLCGVIISLDMHHRDLLQIAEAVPPTIRGIQFQQLLSYNLASRIIKKKAPEHNNIELPITPQHIFNLICCIKINAETTEFFYALFSAFSLIGLSLCTDAISASQKTNLQNVITKLETLHGEIKEGRGSFLDRTKVKMVILRLVSKYTYASRNIQTQSHLDEYFEKSDGIIKIEHVKQSMTDDADSDDESDQGNSATMDGIESERDALPRNEIFIDKVVPKEAENSKNERTDVEDNWNISSEDTEYRNEIESEMLNKMNGETCLDDENHSEKQDFNVVATGSVNEKTEIENKVSLENLITRELDSKDKSNESDSLLKVNETENALL